MIREALRRSLENASRYVFTDDKMNRLQNLTIKIAGAIEDYNYQSKGSGEVDGI